jgi:hypothetical protein
VHTDRPGATPLKTTDAIQAIVRTLSPYVGETMAKASAAAQCRKLGIVEGDVRADDLERLLGRLGTGLNVFLGRDRSAEVVREARLALSALEARR